MFSELPLPLLPAMATKKSMKTKLLKLLGCAALLFFSISIHPTHCAASQVIAWGDNSYGQTNVPPNLTNVLALAGGFSHSFALMSDGTVVGWGDDTFGQTDVPEDLTNAVAIAAGWYHSLALRSDGTVIAWGAGTIGSGSAPDFGQSIVPSDLSNVVAITAGQYHSMALHADGTVRVWGDNSFDQTNVPAVLTNAVAIAAGSNFCLALRADGTVLAWGDNGSHQINVPYLNASTIAAAGSYCLAMNGQGMLTAWGSQATVPAALIAVPPIISVNDGTTDTNESKVVAQEGNVCLNGGTNVPVIIEGAGKLAVCANGRVNLTNATIAGLISMTNYSKGTPVPDYTTQTQGNTYRLFDINRIIAVADATTNGFAPSGNNHFTNLTTFIGAANKYNPIVRASNKNAMEGVIVVDVSMTDPGTGDLDTHFLTNGINIKGSLVFNFTGSGWSPTATKIVINTPVNINPADLTHLVATNPATYTSGYPPAYQNPSLNPTNIDITGITNPATGLTDFQNFTAGDTLPALVGTIGVADLHGSLNISGTMYTPSCMEIENVSSNNVQYVKGSLIMGYGIFLDSQYGAASIFSGNPQPIVIAARASHNLVLMTDGSVFAWGNHTGVPPGLTNVTAIAAGVSHSLALLGNAPPTVLFNAQLANAAWASNGFSFSLPSQNGRVYSMEYSDCLSSNNWTVVSLAAGNGGTLTLTDSTAPGSARFYRVRQW